LAIVVGLEPTRPRLRGALLEPLCIHDRICRPIPLRGSTAHRAGCP